MIQVFKGYKNNGVLSHSRACKHEDEVVELMGGEKIMQGIFTKYLIADNDNATEERILMTVHQTIVVTVEQKIDWSDYEKYLDQEKEKTISCDE